MQFYRSHCWKIGLFLNCLIGLEMTAAEAETDYQLSRIAQLLPNLVYKPNIDPAIPENFVAMGPTKSSTLYDGIFWGPKEVLVKYFQDPESLEQPIIRVAVLTDKERNKLFDHVQLYPEDSKVTDFVLQNDEVTYPIFSIRTKINNRKSLFALMAISSPCNQQALIFELIYPSKDSKPSKEGLKMWNTFVNETQIRTIPVVFK